MRTLGVSIDSDGIADISGTVLDDIEALAERIREAVLFRLGSWFLDVNLGLDYEAIRGHRTTLQIAARTITEAIATEGGSEITSISTPIVSLNSTNRKMSYRAEVLTIYGESITVEQDIG